MIIPQLIASIIFLIQKILILSNIFFWKYGKWDYILFLFTIFKWAYLLLAVYLSVAAIIVLVSFIYLRRVRYDLLWLYVPTYINVASLAVVLFFFSRFIAFLIDALNSWNFGPGPIDYRPSSPFLPKLTYFNIIYFTILGIINIFFGIFAIKRVILYFKKQSQHITK